MKHKVDGDKPFKVKEQELCGSRCKVAGQEGVRNTWEADPQSCIPHFGALFAKRLSQNYVASLLPRVVLSRRATFNAAETMNKDGSSDVWISTTRIHRKGCDASLRRLCG